MRLLELLTSFVSVETAPEVEAAGPLVAVVPVAVDQPGVLGPVEVVVVAASVSAPLEFSPMLLKKNIPTKTKPSSKNNAPEL